MFTKKRLMFTLTAFAFGLSAHSFAKDKFELTSTLEAKLETNRSIPSDYYGNKFSCESPNKSPQLEWKNVPEGTESFMITFYDKSAPTGSGFWHYVLYNIPKTVTKIDEDALSNGKIPEGAIEGNTDRGVPGFFGPCPPKGLVDTYVWTVLALAVDTLPGVTPKSPAALVGFTAWSNKILGTATFEVTATR